MAQDTGGPDFDKLVAQAVRRRDSRVCWAAFAGESAIRFMALLREREEESPYIVNRAEARRIINEEFGLDVSKEAFNRHFRGDCKCAQDT